MPRHCPLPCLGNPTAKLNIHERWAPAATDAAAPCAQVRRLLNAIKANSIANRKPEKHEINNLRRAAHALAEIAKQGTLRIDWEASKQTCQRT